MQLVDISKIQTENDYLRLDTNIEQLKKSIETVGLINPLVINEENKLIAGGRRYCALKELGHKDVPVVIVKKNQQEEELISIDENLVRKDLTKIEVEKSLARGRELYEQLYPEATKFSEEDLSTPDSNEIKKELPNNKRSFIDITAEKTGLSKKVIKSAIDREEKSSDKVKALRSQGVLNATQANELIRLPQDEQEHIADLVAEKSAKEVKDIVKKVNEQGLQYAVNSIVNSPQLPKEYKSLKTLLQRTNKVLGKILIEEMESEHEDVSVILDQISTLRLSLDQFLVLCTNQSTNEKSEEPQGTYNYDDVIKEGMEAFSNSSENFSEIGNITDER